MRGFPIARRERALRAVALCVTLLCSGSCSTMGGADAAPPRSLRILLTNDDGYRSPGLHAVHEALNKAGHRVTVVAPLDNRSGSGSSFTTSGELALVEQRPGVFSVSGTPADAVRVAFSNVLKGETVDLVVSGANFGQNVGPATLHSGTIGAALTAMQMGHSAIAISVGIDIREARSEPRFASTIAAFDDAAAFVTRLVGALDRSRGADGRLLALYTALNVNHPARKAADLTGVRWATIGRDHGFAVEYAADARDPGRLVLGFGSAGEEEQEDGTDTELFDDGYVTVSLLDGDVLAPKGEIGDLDYRIDDLFR